MRWQVACAAALVVGAGCGIYFYAKMRPATAPPQVAESQPLRETGADAVASASRPIVEARLENMPTFPPRPAPRVLPPTMADSFIKWAVERAGPTFNASLSAEQLSDTSDAGIARVATAYCASRGLSANGYATISQASASLEVVRDFLLKAAPSDIHTTAGRSKAVLSLPNSYPEDELTRRKKDILIKDLSTLVSTLQKTPQSEMDIADVYFFAAALAEFDNYGVEIPVSAWKRLDAEARKSQQADGSWLPRKNGPAAENQRSGRATLGLAALLLVRSRMGDVDTAKPDAALEKARIAFDDAFALDSINSRLLNALRTIGQESGLTRAGKVRWKDTLTERLWNLQKDDGAWIFEGETPVESTAAAVEFLAFSRRPVALSKLQYRGDGWNHREQDARFVARHLSKLLERPVEWQVVGFDDPLSDWMESPILLITGDKDPKFAAPEIAKLQAYVRAGGMVLSVSEKDSREFTAAMARVAGEVGDHRYEMRELGNQHDLFNGNVWAVSKTPPRVLSLGNGVREWWMHLPTDMSKQWQERRFHSNTLWGSLFIYTNGKGSKVNRLSRKALILPATDREAMFRMTIARIDHTGNSDPEPGGWERFEREMKRKGIADLHVQTVKIVDLDPAIQPLAILTGTERFTLPAGDVDALRRYLQKGGTLWIEAVGGKLGFMDSATRLLSDHFPQKRALILNRRHPIYMSENPRGAAVETPELRSFTRTIRGPEANGVIGAIDIDGRPAVLISDLDLTCGLLGSRTWAINGYTPETSEQLMTNLILWLANPKPAEPETQPKQGV